MGHYLARESTKEYLKALSDDIGIPISELVQVFKGGSGMQGTWVHPKVAIHLGQWLSPKFAVAVTNWVDDWLTGRAKATLPTHIRRFLANRDKIPHDHFSILNEMFYTFIGAMEGRGYTLPEKMVPDISMGRMFSDFLREAGEDPTSFPTYSHVYEDGRIVDARLYPNRLLQPFRQYLYERWLPERATGYFAERDKKAIPFLEQIMPLGQGGQGKMQLLDEAEEPEESPIMKNFGRNVRAISQVPGGITNAELKKDS